MVPPMQWWNEVLDWFNSSEGNRVVTTMVLPFIAIVVAGIVAAVVARGSISRLLSRQETATRASAVEALIAVGEKASQWSGLSGSTREHFEAQSSVASIRVRLLPAAGSAMASSWAEYQLADIKRNSANFSVQADQGYAEYRDRLIEWHHRPSRARKLFTGDLERFRLDSASDDTDLIERQRRWKAEQSAPATVATPVEQPAHVPTPAAHFTAEETPKSQPKAQPKAESTPLVPSAASRAFVPTTPAATAKPAASTEQPGNTEVIEATIDEDSSRVG
jgi:hypothetical protein